MLLQINNEINVLMMKEGLTK